MTLCCGLEWVELNFHANAPQRAVSPWLHNGRMPGVRSLHRISSARTLAFDCLLHDAQGAPYLRYINTKMRREAAVPIDEELETEIRSQQRRVLQRWPDGSPHLFPRPHANPVGAAPLGDSTYRRRLGGGCGPRPLPMQINPDELPAVILVHRGLPWFVQSEHPQHPPGTSRAAEAPPLHRIKLGPSRNSSASSSRSPVNPVLPFDPVQGDPVDTRHAVVAAHRDPRTPQDISAKDLVPQRIEPSPGIGLGRPVKRML